MAIKTTIETNTLTIKLNNGRTDDGRQKLINVNLTNIKKSAFTQEDNAKAMAIVDKLANVFDQAIYETSLTTRATIEAIA